MNIVIHMEKDFVDWEIRPTIDQDNNFNMKGKIYKDERYTWLTENKT